MSLELLSLSLTAGFSVGLLGWMIANSMREVQEEAEEQHHVYSDGPFFKLVLPYVQYMGRRFERLRLLDGLRRSIRNKLVWAGKSLVISPDEFIAYMTTWGFASMLVAGWIQLTMGIMDLYLATTLFLLSSYLPLMQLSERTRERQKQIRKILPYTLDLLCLAVEAGLDFTAALNRIGENLKNNPLRDEFRMLSQDLNMGKTRAEALRDMERRIGLEELTAVVSALVQADELGASLGPALRIQSEELQRVRFQRAEKKAMQAPVLMLLPMVGCIFPIVFLVIFTPMGLRIMDMFQKQNQ
ncbi:MAG: type II secretion system F family protein [Planctomycetota bacterium]